MLRHVEYDAAHLEPCLGRFAHRPFLPATAELGANARNELAMAEWLGQVVVSSSFQSAHLVLFGIERSQHDDGQLRASSQLLEHFEPIRGAQIDVEHHQVRVALLERTQR